MNQSVSMVNLAWAEAATNQATPSNLSTKKGPSIRVTILNWNLSSILGARVKLLPSVALADGA